MLSSIDARQSVQARIKEKAAQFGNKSANLIELDALCKTIQSDNIQVQIPPIVPLSDAVIKKHLNDYTPFWEVVWRQFTEEQKNKKNLTPRSKKIIQKLQQIIKKCFEEHPLTISEMESLKLPKEILFMIRSTGEEDTTEMANPGGNKSVAAVHWDLASISNAIGTVVASYVSKKSLKQRLLSGDDITKPPFTPVLLQMMIGEKLNGEEDTQNIIISGVMYAKVAMTRLEAAPGHGELIVNSKAPFDIFDVTENGVVHSEIHQKPGRLIPIEIKNDKETKRKLVFVDNPKILQKKPAIEPQIAQEIAMVGQKIQSHYGIPMDIEFVYAPKSKILSIVQARPIPEPKLLVKPSAISPELFLKIKNDSSIDKIKGKIITPAGRAAKIITNVNQVIVMNTLGDALKKYLSDDNNQENIRAIFVKEEAPSTSHEAAIFNALSIPVMQGDVEPVEDWLKEINPAVILDTQHQYAVNIRTMLKEPEFSEKEIKESKIIIEGLFSSVLSPKKTLLKSQGKISPLISKTIEAYLKESPNEITKTFIYHKLLDDIQLLETSKPNQENKESFESLKNISDIFRRLGTSTNAKRSENPHKGLLTHAMIAIADIHLCLESYAKIGDNIDNQMKKRQELLDLISKLKALIINTGEAGLFSDSIMQMTMQHKAENRLPKDHKLPVHRYKKAIELLKLSTLVFNTATKESWEKFVLSCSQGFKTQQKLAKIVVFCIKYHLESDFINHFYLRLQDENVEKTLDKIYNEIKKTEKIFQDIQLENNRRCIESFEKRLLEWSDPKKFDHLYKEWSKELVPLINKIKITNDVTPIAKSVILRQVQYLTDCIDKTIKSLKGSPDYTNEEKGLLLERFVSLLKPYHQLMQVWMQAVPVELYDKWKKCIMDDNYYNAKDTMLQKIEDAFNEKIKNKKERDLEPSNKFSVASCRLGSTASFKRQFIELESDITLEDLFTLFHQNILSSTNILERNNALKKSDDFPASLQPLLKAISSRSDIELLTALHEPPLLKFDFNLPVQNHSIQLCLEYNQNTKNIQLHWKFFGMNWSSRMDYIALKASVECYLVDGNMTDIAKYNKDNRSMEFTWAFTLDKINPLIQHISSIAGSYVYLTEHRNSHGETFEDLYQKYLKNNEYDVSSKMKKDILEKIKNKIGALEKYELRRIIEPSFLGLLSKDTLTNLWIDLSIEKSIKLFSHAIKILPIEAFESMFKYKNSYDDNILTYAAYLNSTELVQFLIEKNIVDIDYKNKEGLTYKDILDLNKLLDFANNTQYDKILEILKENKNITLMTKHHITGETAQSSIGRILMLYARSKTLDELKAFVAKIPDEFLNDILFYKTDTDNNIFSLAASEGNYDHVQYLLTLDKTNTVRHLSPTLETAVNKKIYFMIQYDQEEYFNISTILNKCGLTTLSEDNISLIQEKFIHHAKRGNLDKMKEIQKGLPSDLFQKILLAKDANGDSALSWAAYGAYPLVHFNDDTYENAKNYLEMQNWLLSRDANRQLAKMKNKYDRDYLAPHPELYLIHLVNQKRYTELNGYLQYKDINLNFEEKIEGKSFKQIVKNNIGYEKPKTELHQYIKNFSLELFQALFTPTEVGSILTSVSSEEVILFLEEMQSCFTKTHSGDLFFQKVIKESLQSLLKEKRDDDLIFKILSKFKDTSLPSKEINEIFGKHLEDLLEAEKYFDFEKIIKTYKNLLMDIKIDDKTLISILGKQLIDGIRYNISKFEKIKNAFPIDQYQELYKHIGEYGETLLTWAAYRGNLEIYDWLLKNIQDESYSIHKSEYQFDGLANLGYYATKCLVSDLFALVAVITSKYNIPYDCSYHDKRIFSFNSVLREKFTLSLKNDNLEKANLLKKSIPASLFNSIFLQKVDDKNQTLFSELWKSNLSPTARTWLQENFGSLTHNFSFFPASSSTKSESTTESKPSQLSQP